MRKFGIKLGAVALVSMMAIVFIGCDSGGGGGGGMRRTPVQDGSFTATGWGHNRINPVYVTTQFQNNQIVRISIGQNSESTSFIESVRDIYIPRVIHHQVLGTIPTDTVSGATVSTMAVRDATLEAIQMAGGRPEEWEGGFPRRDAGVVSFDVIYDVIVVGLGGTGTVAYLAASAVPGTSVLGLEAAGSIGGMSARVLGSTMANSTIFTTPAATTVRNQWVVPNAIPGLDRDYFRHDRHEPPSARHQPPHLWGGADPGIVDWFLADTGPTVDWLHTNHFAMGSMPFGASTLAIIQGGTELRSQIFHRAITDASRSNVDSAYATEMRAMSLLPPTPGFPYYTITVRHDRTGRDFQVLGRTVVLATGGFLANPDMMREHFGISTARQTIYTQRGDGIRMGMQAGGATYNIRMPFVGNQASVLNIVQPPIPEPAGQEHPWHGGLRWKNTVASMTLSTHSMMVAMEMAFNGSNYVGQRFMAESPGAVGARWFGSGGFFATIYCQDNIDRIRTTGFRAGEPATSFLPQNIGGAFYNPTTGANPTNAWAAGHPIAEIDAIIDWAVSTGNAIRANNLADLATQLSVRSQTASQYLTEARLRQTIEAYNALAGTDTQWAGPPGTVHPISEDWSRPFVAFLGAAYFYGTSGGLDIDVNMQVLDVNHNPIPGLFAGGQDAMGVIFDAYEFYGPSGAANAWALTSGRRAGSQAAAAAAAMR